MSYRTYKEMPVNRSLTLSLFYLAVFLQAGAYGLTFMLPRLFDGFGANEKVVGWMLFITTISTLTTVYFSGHLSDRFGRVRTLGVGCTAIAVALVSYAYTTTIGLLMVLASALLGFGWGLTYTLAPIVLTRLTAAKERVRYFAILSVAVMAGFGLSPVLASVLEGFGFHIKDAFYATAILCAIAAILFFWLISAINSHALQAGPERRSSLSLSAVSGIFRSRARLPVIMVCIGACVFRRYEQLSDRVCG